jgi:hypothetical protein
MFFPTNKIYNPQYKILFKFNPTAQCILGQFDGWQKVYEAFLNCREYDAEYDEVKFIYTQNKWNKLIEYIKRCDDE